MNGDARRNRNGRRGLALLAVLLVAALVLWRERDAPTAARPQPTTRETSPSRPQASERREADLPRSASGTSPALADAISSRKSNVQVDGEGTVVAVLRDDRKGSRHQRFLLRLESGETVLIAHNIDLAPRIDALEKGDRVAFRGEYEWNEKGGVVHWTHHDPDGSHEDGWLRHQGRTYQ